MSVKNHPLIRSLLDLRGNPRACVYTEPLWGIPYFLYAPYISVYMSALLLTDRQIGIVASITLFSRAVFALLGGALTDKFGRRKTTFIIDLISWSVPCLLWAYSQNFWWFVVAGAFNGILQVTDNSWNCLLVEDAQKSQLVNIYTWVHISGQLAIFFAPLSGLIVNKLTLIPAMRILYIFAFISMTAKFIILYKYSDETEIGIKRMKETAGMSIFKIISGYGVIVKKIAGSTEMLTALALNTLFTITSSVTQNFFGLYTTQNLMVPQYFLSIFPIIRSAILLLFLFFIQSKISKFGYKVPMVAGILLYITAQSTLLIASGGVLIMPIVYTVLEACAHGLVMPRKDSLVALFIEKSERARIVSVMTVTIFAINIPFGYISGFLSDINRRLPFIMNIAIFSIAVLVIAFSRKLSAKDIKKLEDPT